VYAPTLPAHQSRRQLAGGMLSLKGRGFCPVVIGHSGVIRSLFMSRRSSGGVKILSCVANR